MVRRQIEQRGVTHSAVLSAMRTVARHCFVPFGLWGEAYEDHPLPIGFGQTISQPYIVARMTELLDPSPSHRVLEIGTGSGYQTAVLSRVVRTVYSVEIDPSLASEASRRLSALGVENAQIRQGDGYFGWTEQAPFDGILVTAAAREIPPPLVRQLKPGGRMVLPVGRQDGVQQLTVLTKDLKGSVSTRIVLPVRFVPLVGEH
jgi:protein-L-isoaspartate(D-aspartate) O-methyltransferase